MMYEYWLAKVRPLSARKKRKSERTHMAVPEPYII